MTTENNDHNRNYIEWLQHEVNYYGRYHDHKETMAWLATALYLPGVLYVAFKVRDTAADCWVNQFLFSLFIAITGYLVFCFVKWQFEKRWTAHEKVLSLKRDLKQAVFCSKSPAKPNYESITRGSCELGKSLKYLSPCKLCGSYKAPKNGLEELDDEEKHEPLKTEAITYIGITFFTIVAIALVLSCINRRYMVYYRYDESK